MDTTDIDTSKANSLPKGCLTNLHPERQRFDFDELTIDTLFDSANLASATKYKDLHYHLTISPDGFLTANQTTNKTWFYFRVTNVKNRGTYTFTVKNMNRQMKLYHEGLSPVFKAIPSSPKWSTIRPQTILMKTVDKDLEVTFNHALDPNDHEVYLAYTYPWSYTDDQELLDQIESQYSDSDEIYFHRELLTYSREKRKIELLTISSHSNKTEQREDILPNLFPKSQEVSRAFKFENKKYVVISSRVHSGETPASYVFKGLLNFLLNKDDERSKAFREQFVIVLIPMLNPDGVSRGHYRNDTYGLNLNRYYINPSRELHPSIYAAKQIMLNLYNRGDLFLYCDLHAHANVKGCFVYGNSMNFRDLVEGRLFPKILSLNSKYFEYPACDFSDTNTGPGKGDGKEKEKEGAGRVALYKETGLPRCYTLECNYSAGKLRNVLSLPSQSGVFDENNSKQVIRSKLGEAQAESIQSVDVYTSESFEEIGEAIGPTLLDMIGHNPISRLPSGPYKNVENVKLHIGLALMKDLRFKFDPFFKKINQDLEANIDVLKEYIEQGVQLETVAKPKKETGVRPKKKSTTNKPLREAVESSKDKLVVIEDSNQNKANINFDGENREPEVQSTEPIKPVDGKENADN